VQVGGSIAWRFMRADVWSNGVARAPAILRASATLEKMARVEGMLITGWKERVTTLVQMFESDPKNRILYRYVWSF
jgi:hypothetical protein